MKRNVVLDSFALLAYLEKERGCEKAAELFAARHEDGTVIMNAINVGETYYILARERGQKEADFFLDAIIPSLNIRLEFNDLTGVIEAARIKAAYPISFADAFAAATAAKYSATLITGDPDFRKLGHMVDIHWLG